MSIAPEAPHPPAGSPVSPEPVLPGGRVEIEAPPTTTEAAAEGSGGLLMNLIPLIGAAGSIALVASMGGSNPTLRWIAAGLVAFTTVAFVVIQWDRERRRRGSQLTGSRRAYLHHLAGVRAAVRSAAAEQRHALLWRHPDPQSLPAVAEERSRLFEQQPGSSRFGQVRYGVGAHPLALDLVLHPSPTPDQVDPVAAAAAQRLVEVHRLQPDLPLTLDLAASPRIEISGEAEARRALARSLICSATATHDPGHLVVAVLADETSLARWDWIKWLPHAHSHRTADAVGPARMVATSAEDLARMLPADLAERPRFGTEQRAAIPHLLLLVDGEQLPHGRSALPLGADGVHGVTVVELRSGPAPWDDPQVCRMRLDEAREGRVPVRVDHRIESRGEPTGPIEEAYADQTDLATAEAYARRVASAPRHHATAGIGEISGPADFMDLLGLGSIHTLDASTAWRDRPVRDRLRVPIGLDEAGLPVHLDLKESAQQGMGPHGLVIGATGSGKSEFLRTLVLGLALTHSPNQLNMILVDFKGGATFSGMSQMPHVSAVITNLAQELTLVDRMQDALSGEMVRRQEILREAGNFSSIRDYEKARAAGEPLEPMPSLLIVVDEFSEMLSAKPEFLDLFVAIGRLGRSLGLHLLLASQRLDEGRLRGLESHLSYRIGLRTFSAAESRAVLGVPDAYELPSTPGLGYLKPDQSTLVRFKAAYVSAPPAAPRSTASGASVAGGILPFSVAPVHTTGSAAQTSTTQPTPTTPPNPGSTPGDATGDATGGATGGATDRREGASLLDLSVEQMLHAATQARTPSAHQVWLPPLDVPDTLDALMPDLTADPQLGLGSPGWRGYGGLVVPLGTVDRPREQRRETLTLDLAGAGGHVAVVGGPRSGKSTLLRTLVASVCLSSTPSQSQFYVLDFGGGTFSAWRDAPHVAGVASRSEPDVVARVIAEVSGILDARERHFAAQGIDTIETYRMRRARGQVDDGYGDVFLVVDGWSTLRSDFEELEIQLQQLAARGLTFGVHLIVGAGRWADFRSAMRDVFGTRLELRLGDPMDSELDRKVAELVPAHRPGRGLTAQRLHFLAALPRIDGRTDVADLADGVQDLLSRLDEAWTQPSGPKLRLLPDRIDLADLRIAAGTGPDTASGAADGGREPAAGADRRLLLGLDEKALAPVGWDPDAEPHLLVFGDGQSGKSSLLRTVVHEITRTRSPQQAQIVTVDYRRALLGEVSEDYLLHYLTSGSMAQPALGELAAYLENRLPGPDVTPEQLRNRSWWTGAEVFLLVDDYDLVATGQGSPLQPLVPLLAQAHDVGLHLVLARRSGGAGRAMYEPVIQALRDLAQPGLLLSGNPEEGYLLGSVRPTPAAPGRARMVTRDRGVEVVQVAWHPPAH